MTDITRAIAAAKPAETKRPKALLRKIANKIAKTSLNTLVITFKISINLASRLARKVLSTSGFNAVTIAKITKAIENMVSWRIKSRAGDQTPSPERKIRASTMDVSPLKVKHAFNMSLPFFPEPGRKRISPIPKPNSEKMAIIPKAEIVAVVSPIASME